MQPQKKAVAGHGWCAPRARPARQVSGVKRASQTVTNSPARQVTAFIAKFDPTIAKLARQSRAALRKRLPTAIELVYDNYNALAIGFSSTERTSNVIVSLAVYARGINLYFMYGAMLPDPQRVLHGSGNQGRFVRLEKVSDLDDPAVSALLREAIRQSDPPLERTRHGYTIVKSISAKQRPRR